LALRTPTARAWTPGFTLIELLVAISILAVVALLSWRGLSSLTATRERLEPQNEEVHAVLAGFGQLELDLARVPVSPALFAYPSPPVHVLTIDGQPALQILRLADAPDGSHTTAVQTVLYLVRAGALQRQSGAAQRFYSPEATMNLNAVALVPNIVQMQVRVWRNNVGWITPGSDADAANVPGIEVRLLRADGSSLRRVLAVG